MTRVFLSLGSNLGDREAQLQEALRRLDAAGGVAIVQRSSIRETEPQDLVDQPKFLNIAAEAVTDLSAVDLLARIHAIEADMGRVRTVPKGPRTIDIDILFYGDVVIETPELQIPHPRLAARRFVLEPLAEIAPDLRHPVMGLTICELLAASAS